MRSGRACFLFLAVAGAAFAVFTLRGLPPRMATHFNLAGQADAWSSRGSVALQ